MMQTILTIGSLIGTLATAVATFFLWRVTGILAVETKRMADAAAQPLVVANLIPNQWALNHIDLIVENTGNATAFDIELKFDPPLENGEVRSSDRPIPLQNISILKPGQSLSSYLAEFEIYKGKSFKVDVTWKVKPVGEERQLLSYTFNMADYEGITRLGSASPTIQIAEEIKHIREDWKKVANGQGKLKADVYSSYDRQREREQNEERYREIRERNQTNSSSD
ncbi:MAG: hypothetical protein NVV72_10510 [Asticcacaulis sp.]|nr:hypothetical protein [Asticcacaulis sp.]